MYVPFDETDPETMTVNAIENGTAMDNEMSKLVKFTKPIISRKKKLLNNENEKTREKMLAIRNKMSENKRLKLMSKRKTSASTKQEISNGASEGPSASISLKSASKSELNANSSSSNLDNIRMKRYQIVSDPKQLVAAEILPTIKKNASASQSNIEAQKEATNSSTKIMASRTNTG